MRQRAARRHGVEGVRHEIQQCELELRRVRIDRPAIVVQPDVELHARSREPRPGNRARAIDDEADAGGDARRGLSRLVQHRPQNAGDLRQLRLDNLETLAHHRLGVGILADHLDVAGDEVERRADLVRDLRRHLADSRHAFGPGQRLLQAEHTLIALLEFGVPHQQLRCCFPHALLEDIARLLQPAQHLVQTVGHRPQLVASHHRRTRRKVAFRHAADGVLQLGDRPMNDATRRPRR